MVGGPHDGDTMYIDTDNNPEIQLIKEKNRLDTRWYGDEVTTVQVNYTISRYRRTHPAKYTLLGAMKYEYVP